jgi:hypothetical protein
MVSIMSLIKDIFVENKFKLNRTFRLLIYTNYYQRYVNMNILRQVGIVGGWFEMGLILDDRFPNERQYGARQALLTMTAVNLLNFADRYIPSAVKQLIIDDLHLSDFESSLPSTGMVVVYMVILIIIVDIAKNLVILHQD